jgi:hypothetical protein
MSGSKKETNFQLFSGCKNCRLFYTVAKEIIGDVRIYFGWLGVLYLMTDPQPKIPLIFIVAGVTKQYEIV